MQADITNIVDFESVMAFSFYEFCTFRVGSVILGARSDHYVVAATFFG
jgi:hypothetical protein